MTNFAVINGITRLSRLADEQGNITHALCPLCMDYFELELLYVDPDGQRWDYCWACAFMEHPTYMTWPGHDEHGQSRDRRLTG